LQKYAGPRSIISNDERYARTVIMLGWSPFLMIFE
jgi:hypothetical protein